MYIFLNEPEKAFMHLDTAYMGFTWVDRKHDDLHNIYNWTLQLCFSSISEPLFGGGTVFSSVSV